MLTVVLYMYIWNIHTNLHAYTYDCWLKSLKLQLAKTLAEPEGIFSIVTEESISFKLHSSYSKCKLLASVTTGEGN